MTIFLSDYTKWYIISSMARIRKFIPIILLSLIPTLLIWAPFFFRIESVWTIPLPKDGMATIVANYDGPLYIAVAKSLYNPDILKQFYFNLSPSYYAAHFPLYPILIKLFSFAIGFPYSMLLVTTLSSIVCIFVFSKFISDFVDKKDILWMTFIFSIFPARWLTVRSVGSPEPLFIALVISSIYFFKRKKYLLAAILAGFSAMTKSPGILLFPALLLSYFYPLLKETIKIKKENTKIFIKLTEIFPLLIIPISTLVVFWIFKLRLNDFLAYFHSGDNIHLFFPPFQIFNYQLPWVGTFWLEEVIFVFLLGAVGLMNLVKKDQTSAWFAIIFFISTLFIAHRDIVRYSLPIIPFILAGYSQYLVKKEFRYPFYLIIIPIYLFSLAFISKNIMPISDWRPLL